MPVCGKLGALLHVLPLAEMQETTLGLHTVYSYRDFQHVMGKYQCVHVHVVGSGHMQVMYVYVVCEACHWRVCYL